VLLGLEVHGHAMAAAGPKRPDAESTLWEEGLAPAPSLTIRGSATNGWLPRKPTTSETVPMRPDETSRAWAGPTLFLLS
jgi:hypothetical protein